MSNFHPLKVDGRDSETQTKVGEKLIGQLGWKRVNTANNVSKNVYRPAVELMSKICT